MKKQKPHLLIRNFLVELILYGILVVGYFFLVLQLLGEPLAELFRSNLVVYAFLSLGLIVVQGSVLEVITSFLLEQLQLDKLE